MPKVFLLFAAILLASCSSRGSKTSPVIYFSNASPKEITSINAIWAEGNILTLNRLAPGDTRSQSFYLDSTSDFFGLVRISWTNGDKESVSREFFFRKNNLPEIDDTSTYNYVQIYLEQNDLEVMSSNATDLSSKTKRRDNLLNFYKNQNSTSEKANIPTSLIRVEPIKERSNPMWIDRSF